MGVYIKDMEMPKDEEMLCINIYPDGKVCINLDLECTQIATAVSVPPHGRLIDADALRAKQQEDADLFQGSTAYGDKCRRDEAMNAVANIVNAPTIIPADGKDTDVPTREEEV